MAVLADDVDLGRDHDLVVRFQNGDPEAFDDLYRRYFDRLRRFCLRLTGDVHESEEVAQEAFVKALRAMHSLEGERRFYPWLTVIARRVTIDRHRRSSRVELTDEPDLGVVEPDVEHLFAEVDAAHVRAALDNVRSRHREVLLLREGEGRSYAEIAATLDVPVTTVEALLHRARKALRREYAAVGGERRGFLGFPVLGWAATRAADLRSRIGDRWVEVASVLAPVAVGAATAAVVLLPADDPPSVHLEATGSPVTAVHEPEVVTPDPLPAPSTTVDPPPTAPPSLAPPTTAAPTVEAGPVDVFLGEEATDRARAEAEEMPVHATIGPAVAGADVPEAEAHLRALLEEALDSLTRPPPAETDASDPTILDTLLGGNP